MDFMKKYVTQGLIAPRTKGGMLRCEECGCILGYLNAENVESAYLHLVCRCGGNGVVVLGDGKELSPSARANATASHRDCPECRRSWFTAGENVKAFSFRFVCVCGCCAEISHQSKRNVYEELDFLK